MSHFTQITQGQVDPRRKLARSLSVLESSSRVEQSEGYYKMIVKAFSEVSKGIHLFLFKVARFEKYSVNSKLPETLSQL